MLYANKKNDRGADINNISNFLNSLYTSYLLRDFLAKVFPGSLVLASAIMFPGDISLEFRRISLLPIWFWLLRWQ